MANIKNYFERDNFRSRRTTGCYLYDPEALLTGAEIEQGLDYGDKRQWLHQALYDGAVSGSIPVDAIPLVAPRRKS